MYRDWWNGNRFYFVVYGRDLANLSSYGYFPLDIEPGNLKINVVRGITPPFLYALLENILMKGDVLLEIDAKAGETYYVRFTQRFGSVKLTLKRKKQALKALKELRMTKDLRKAESAAKPAAQNK